MSAPHEANPDSRPLPDGWITEHSPAWNQWYYVNTKDPNPQAVWHHPADNAGAAPAGAPPGAASPSAAATPSNPDTRPLPLGYISEYSPEHKTWYYVNTNAADPGSTVTWTHPADAKDSGHSVPATSTPPVPTSSAGGKHNPDTRPLPAGWITDYDENYKSWYYVDTNHPEKGSVWQHPSETHGPSAASTAAATAPLTGSIPPPYQGQQHSPVPAAAGPGPSTSSPEPLKQSSSYTGPPASENPDKRPLPAGWITKFDENYKVWYYVDTSKPGGPSSWEHPSDKTTAPGATPGIGGTGAPTTSGAHGPGSSTTPGGHSSNPDSRPLPAGWITQYDNNRNTWFYVNTTVHPPQTTWEHPTGKLVSSPTGAPPINLPGSNTGPGSPGKGLEGLLGAKGGKLVGGFLGAKARTQMDGFADIIGGEVNKFKKNHPPGGAPPGQQGQGQYQTPPGGQSQYQAPPGQVPGQAVPPPANPPPASGTGGGGLGGSLGNLSGMAGKFGFGKK